MKCNICGTENPEGSSFCKKCGFPLKKTDSNPEPPKKSNTIEK